MLRQYEAAIATLVRQEKLSLAACLAASAVAHLPLQPELSPLTSAVPPPAPASAAKKSQAESAASPSSESGGHQKNKKKKKQLRRKPTPAAKRGAAAAPSANASRLRARNSRRASILNARERLRFILQRESLKRINSISKTSTPSTSTPRCGGGGVVSLVRRFRSSRYNAIGRRATNHRERDPIRWWCWWCWWWMDCLSLSHFFFFSWHARKKGGRVLFPTSPRRFFSRKKRS